ncbi:hypothetical protein IOC57_17535 [Bacillus sp. SD075]|nr:hypothetical protein [Bacillus sp. SD075]MBO0999537.1 hypothetical protein [Bacillus sp. SD075]
MFHLVNGQVIADAGIVRAMEPKDVIRGILLKDTRVYTLNSNACEISVV